MPKAVDNATNTSAKSGSIIFPDVETSKVPRTKRAAPWKPVPGTSRYEWTRGDGDSLESWRVNMFLHRLQRGTYAYQDIYINTNVLNNVNPNDKTFRTLYNKWILQFARRRDATYTQKVVRIHWSVSERHALYTSINKFCTDFGIDKFGFSDGCELGTKQLQRMADFVNTVPNSSRTMPRGVDAVRGQIVSSHDRPQPKNKAIFHLLAKAALFRSRIASGEEIFSAERQPELAIPLSQFPVDDPEMAPGRLTRGGKKRKRVIIVEKNDKESFGSELSSPPGSGGANAAHERSWLAAQEHNRPDRSGRKRRSDARDEALSSEEWV